MGKRLSGDLITGREFLWLVDVKQPCNYGREWRGWVTVAKVLINLLTEQMFVVTEVFLIVRTVF